MPKTNLSGQSLTLTPDQLDAVMSELNPISRVVLSTCRYTAARITEALSLKWENVTPTDIVIPKAVTKKNMKTNKKKKEKGLIRIMDRGRKIRRITMRRRCRQRG